MTSDTQPLLDLQAAFASGQKLKFVLFWGHTPKGDALGPWCFSQWWSAPFTVDGLRYPTAEHFMMAEKARLFGDADARARILASGSPAQAKAIGRAVRGFVESTWIDHRFSIVTAASTAKFTQDARLRAYLLATGKRVLVEASPRDPVWGIGLAAEDPAAKNPLRWRGLNLLGFSLMQVRARL